jgi:hypothetical protein
LGREGFKATFLNFPGFLGPLEFLTAQWQLKISSFSAKNLEK